jgi:hypothetical protein
MEHNDTIKILSNKKFPRENDEKKHAERFEKVINDYEYESIKLNLIIHFFSNM